MKTIFYILSILAVSAVLTSQSLAQNSSARFTLAPEAEGGAAYSSSVTYGYYGINAVFGGVFHDDFFIGAGPGIAKYAETQYFPINLEFKRLLISDASTGFYFGFGLSYRIAEKKDSRVYSEMSGDSLASIKTNNDFGATASAGLTYRLKTDKYLLAGIGITRLFDAKKFVFGIRFGLMI